MEIRGEATPALELVRQMKLATGEGTDLVSVAEAQQGIPREDLRELIGQWFTPDIEWDLSGSRWAGLGLRKYRGYDEWFGYWADLLEVFTEFRFRTEWLQSAGEDQVLSEATSSGSFRETGLPWHDTTFELWTVRDGKVSRLVFLDSLEDLVR